MASKNKVQYVDITIPSKNFSKEDVMKMGVEHFREGMFQLEKGASNGYLHWQIRGCTKERKVLSKNRMMEVCSEKLAHWSPTVTKNKKDYNYVTKECTREEGPFELVPGECGYVPRHLRGLELRDWQKSIVESKNSFSDRYVDCLVDVTGCSGKSTVASWNQLHGTSIRLPSHTDSTKLLQSCHNQLSGKKLRQVDHVFVDLPRAMGKEKLAGLFSAIETIKGGYVYDERHTFKEWWFDSPVVWVFTNKLPDTDELSKDRWRFWRIEKNRLVPYVTEGYECKGNAFPDEGTVDNHPYNEEVPKGKEGWYTED